MKYFDLIDKINSKKVDFDYKIVGKSILGEEILCFHLGKYFDKQILLTGGIHAREYISTLFLLKEMDFLKNKSITCGIYFLPMINPDGIRLVLENTEFILDEKLKNFLIDVNEGEDFSLWKANINGVDLNVNFDAKWGKGKYNKKVLGRENFIGYYPNSERENINIINFLREIKIDCHIAFHSKGEVIYYGFEKSEKSLRQEEKIVDEIAKTNGYEPIKNIDSTGGLSDFISQEYDIPSFTIELASDTLSHPINETYLDAIFEKNKKIIEIVEKIL